MPEIVHACGKKLTFPPGSEGRKGKCPRCGGPVEVPKVSAAYTASEEAFIDREALPGQKAPPPPPPPPAGVAPAGVAPEKKRSGLAPTPRLKDSGPVPALALDPPPGWDAYQAYLDGRGPAPRSFVMPANLMLKTEADEQWKRAEAQGPPSKYKCPGCQKTIHVGDLICLACGVDFRLGQTVDGEKKVTEAGRDYLSKIPWLKDAPPPEYSTGDDDGPSDAQKKLASKLGKKKRRRR